MVSHLLTRRAVAVAAAAAAGMAATCAHVGTPQLTQHLCAAQHLLLCAAAAAGLDHHIAANLSKERGEGARHRWSGMHRLASGQGVAKKVGLGS